MTGNRIGSEGLNISRRNFIRCSGGIAGAVTVSGLSSSLVPNQAAAAALPAKSSLKRGSVVLFQGDSITDAGRDRSRSALPNQQTALGNGYAWIAASCMLVDQPQHDLQILNRGI